VAIGNSLLQCFVVLLEYLVDRGSDSDSVPSAKLHDLLIVQFFPANLFVKLRDRLYTFISCCSQGAGDGSFTEVYAGPQKQYKLTKLSPSTSYAFRLAAVNSIGPRSVETNDAHLIGVAR